MKTRIVAVPFLSVMLLATTPALAEQPHPSTRDEATSAGSATTDPGVGSDRIPPDASAPTGEAGQFEERDRDRERRFKKNENQQGKSDKQADYPDGKTRNQDREDEGKNGKR